MKRFYPYFTIILVCGGLYLNTLFFNFTYWDDNYLIIDSFYFNRNIKNIITAFSKDVFRAIDTVLYRPMMNILFILEAQVGGKEPLIYHTTNLVLHIITSCLLLHLLLRLNYEKYTSLLFSLMFAVHPVLVSNVAWIPGRNDTLLATFILLWLISFINFIDTTSWIYLLVQMLSFLLALFTKENAILIPLIGLSFVILRRRHLLSKKNILLYTTWCVAVCIWLILRHSALTNPARIQLDEIKKLSLYVIPAGIIQYIGKIFLPVNLSPVPIIEDTPLLYGLIATLLLTFIVSKTKNIYTTNFVLGALWFLLFLLPPFTAYFHNYGILLESRLYLPLIGLIISLPETDLIKNAKKKILNRVCLVIIIVFSILTYRYSRIFKDKITFWEYAAKTSPHLPLVYRNLGAMYYLEGNLHKAEDAWKKALALNPVELMVHNNLGLIYMKKGMYREAEEEFKKELAINPLFDTAHYNYGLLCLYTNRLKEAEYFLKKTLEINPEYIDAIQLLMNYYSQMGDYSQAKYYAEKLKSLGVQDSQR
jgi:hypothetical protein